MSHITSIKGWIEIFDQESNISGFQEAIQHLECPHGFAFRCARQECEDHKYKSVPNMFTLIPDSGDKQPGYVVFVATINYADVNEFTEFFEEVLLKRLSGMQAFAFISTEQVKSFCKRYIGNRKKGVWELVETLEFFTDDIGEGVLKTNPEIKNADSLARMLLRLF